MTPKVAVIGAGLAGLTAAHRLLARGMEVTVIDKGRHGGGRMCTRNMPLPDGRTARFDLGPPILYPRRAHLFGLQEEQPAAFRAATLAGELACPRLFRERLVGRIGAENEPASYAPITGLAAVGGMRELLFRLLTAHRDALDFRDHTLVERLERTADGWRLHVRSLRDNDQSIISANGLILTPPVPQLLELLAGSEVPLPDDLRDTLRRVSYSRCIAAYGVFTGAGPLQPGGVWFGDGTFDWISDNHAKEVSRVPYSITALTTDEWAREHWEQPDTAILEQLIPRLRSWVGEPAFTDGVQLQRWMWAKPLTPVQMPCALVRDLNIVLAGDGFAASQSDPADGAIASGEAAAERMASLLTALLRADNRYTVARPRRYTLEIAVSTLDEAEVAEMCGADRLELCSALELGGLTPSLGVFHSVRARVEVPIYVMIRPRAGGFVYSGREFDVMRADAEAFMEEGANGIVFGILLPDAEIDRERCRTLVEIAKGKAVFHRAFDLHPDPRVALDTLITLGFQRVLTSGGATTAEAGTTRLESLVQHAGWQIEVLPAGGIRPHNVADLVRATRCDQVHAAPRVEGRDRLPRKQPGLVAGFGQAWELSAELVDGLRYELDLLIELLS